MILRMPFGRRRAGGVSMIRRVLLLYPPHTRGAEPPLGVALLAAFLREHGLEVRVVDVNVEAAPALAAAAPDGAAHRAHRAHLHVAAALQSLRGQTAYGARPSYGTAVTHYAEALRAVSRGRPWRVSPADYTDDRFRGFGPVTAARIMAEPEGVPFHALYQGMLSDAVQRFAPDLIGISLIYRAQFVPGLALAAWCRQALPGVPLAFGGGLVAGLPPATCAYLDAHVGHVVAGDGEPALAQLAHLSSESPAVFRDPWFGDTPFGRYFAPLPVIPVTSTRGCYWRRCAFCAEGARAFRQDRPAEFLARLRRLHALHGPCLFHFTDNAVSPAVLRALASEGSPAPWFGFARAEPLLCDAAFVRDLARGGCRMLELGLETPSARLVAAMRKGVDPAAYPRILTVLRDAGIRSYVYLLFGLPGQTREECEAAAALLDRAPCDYLNASIFQLPPASEIARNPAAYAMAGPLGARDGRLYHEFEAEGMSRRELRRWMSGTFARHPAVRGALARTPRHFKSNHAVFF